MTGTAYLNGDFLSEDKAKISIFDRSVLFGDAIYEVTCVLDGKLLGFTHHMTRLRSSAELLQLHLPVDEDALQDIHRELVGRNNLETGLIYLQMTRGASGARDYLFPDAKTPPTLFAFVQHTADPRENPQAETGLKIITLPDLRWGRRDIKTVQLLYPSMAKMEAQRADCDDAWLVQDGMITEGTSNNAGIILDGALITRQLGTEILPGITRAVMLKCAAQMDLQIEQRPFSVTEALAASEAFITSSMNFVMPVVEIDGALIGNGTPGPVVRQLRQRYLQEAIKEQSD